MKRIRFIGQRGEVQYCLKLGSIGLENPTERWFDAEDEISVEINPNAINNECVDLVFLNGEYAIEVPKEFFYVI
jgi:hypothetical protein